VQTAALQLVLSTGLAQAQGATRPSHFAGGGSQATYKSGNIHVLTAGTDPHKYPNSSNVAMQGGP